MELYALLGGGDTKTLQFSVSCASTRARVISNASTSASTSASSIVSF